FSVGFSYSRMDNYFSGSRIYGSDFDVGYVPNAEYGFGYFDLSGKSRMNEYVSDVNLFYQLVPDLSITPSLRVEEDISDAESTAIETLGTSSPVPFTANGDAGNLDVRSRLDLTYKGFTNWVVHARAELTDSDGNLDQYGGLIPIGGIGVPGVQSGIEERNFI